MAMDFVMCNDFNKRDAFHILILIEKLIHEILKFYWKS